jgi:catechol-2,3-dioxygenase
VKLAKMATGNGVGFEIFEFISPKMKTATYFEYERRGFFHICVTDANPDKLADKVEAAGGKRIGKKVDPSQKGMIQCQYLSDPWGNAVEVLDVGFETMGCLSAL